MFKFPEVRVVEASAGSGKTYALAKRYIQLIFNPNLPFDLIPVRNILAITFTNKASQEMKGRILSFLKAIAFDTLPQSEFDEIFVPLGVSKEVAREKAFSVMDDIIHHYNFFQVQTIDKFINALLSGCAFKIGLTANFKIKTNSNEYLEYSLDELIDSAAGNSKVKSVLDEFLHNYLYLENRSGWFPKKDMLSIVSQLYSQYCSYGLELKAGPMASMDIVKRKGLILNEMRQLKENLPDGVDGRFVRSFNAFLDKHMQGFDIDSVSDYFAREEIPLNKGKEASDDVHKLWSNIHNNLVSLCEQETYSLFNPYINVFQFVLEALYARTSKDDILFLSELNKQARKLFDEDGVTVEELYYRLATRFHHYLIDEFQDTSRLQWQSLNSMVEEALSSGGSLFYVGDQKQAIYSFRGGDVTLFNDVKKTFKPFNVQVENLTQNWRSQKAIVEFNNQIFSKENIERFIRAKEAFEEEKKKTPRVVFSNHDCGQVLNIFESSLQKSLSENAEGYVRMEYVDAGNKEDRDEILCTKIIDLIRDVKTRYRDGDIAILARNNSQVESLTSWLLEEGFSVESERTSNVQSNKIIEELVYFLRFLQSPIDNIAFCKFLLGDLFAKAAGLSSGAMNDFIFSLRKRITEEKDLYLYTEFRKSHPELWDQFIAEFFKNVGLYPLYELTVSIYHKFNCLHLFKEQQGFLMHFLELIKKSEAEYSSISDFLDYFENLKGEDLFVHMTDTDAIKILTIHKSKGLEFPVVIIPFLGMDIQPGEHSDNKQSYVLKKQEKTVQLLRLKSKYYKFSDKLFDLYAQEYKKAFVSELNSVYVALTRPRDELYAFIPKKIQNTVNPLKFLIPDEIYECGKKSTPRLKSSLKDKSIIALECSPYQDWIEYLQDEYLAFEQIKNRSSRRRGEILHFMVSQLLNLNEENFEDEIKKAEYQALNEFVFETQVESYSKELKEFLMNKHIKPLFFDLSAMVFTEKEFIDKKGQARRIDRMLVSDKEVQIIDFKSSSESQDEHYKQVQDYLKILKDVYPTKQLKGVIVYFDSAEVKAVTIS